MNKTTALINKVRPRWAGHSTRPFHKTVFPYTEINTEINTEQNTEPIEGSVTEIRKNTEIDTEEYGSKYGSIRLPYFSLTEIAVSLFAQLLPKKIGKRFCGEM